MKTLVRASYQGRSGYVALMVFLLAYLATLALVIAPERVMTTFSTPSAVTVQAITNEVRMIDGRFDQHFAELFAESLADKDQDPGQFSPWPMLLVCLVGSIVVGSAVLLG